MKELGLPRYKWGTIFRNLAAKNELYQYRFLLFGGGTPKGYIKNPFSGQFTGFS